jgi:hypothetical protein
MPQFNVTLIRRVEFSGVVIVTAKDEDAATAKAQKMIAAGEFGELAPEPIVNVKAEMEGTWTEQNDEVEVDAVEDY